MLCSVCGGRIGFNVKDLSYLQVDCPAFCSFNCFVGYVRTSRHVGLPAKCSRVTSGLAPGDIWFPRLHQAFRSNYEGIVAETMRFDLGWEYEYESVVLDIDGVHSYIADFYLPQSGLFLEVKGVWRGGGKRKFKKALSMIGEDRLLLLPDLYRHWFSKSAGDFLS